MKAQQIRQANRAVVERYMRTAGQERLKRHELFTEDGCGGLWTSDSGEPIMIRGRERLAEHAVWSLRCFPYWEWYNVEIFDTQDPEIFWVECDGKGLIRFEGYEEGVYENHFIHYFAFSDGKIRLQREFMNPCQQFRALGIAVPTIVRAGIPT
jgi:ketosteroid isomerase-like protein